jgi:hypothetical protein
MDEGFLLSEQAVRKTAEAIQQIRGMIPTGGRGAQGMPPDKLWYKVQTNEGAGAYTLRKQEWNASTHKFQNVTNTNDPEYGFYVTGYDCQGNTDGQVGDLVAGWKLVVDGAWVTLIDLAGAATKSFFAVRVLKTGGAAGNKTTQCAFVYTVKDLDGNVMNKKRDGSGDPATGMTPDKPRPSVGKMVAPPDDTYYGLAFWHGEDLTLWDAGETYDPTPCP